MNLFIGILVGLVLGLGIAAIHTHKQAKDRKKRQFNLRNAILQWALSYREAECKDFKPDPTTIHGRLLNAIYYVGTNNLLSHENW